MNFIDFDSVTHYETFLGWAEGHSFSALPLEALPTTGVVARIGEKPVAMGFLYQTDSAIGWLEWIMVDPQVRGPARDEAINGVIDQICLRAESDCAGRGAYC